MYTTYVLYSPKYQKIYIGQTADLDQRMLSHNVLSEKGFTSRFRPWVIIYTEEYLTRAEAMKREKQLKSSAGRRWIWKLVEDRFGPP
ncbi:MAG: endonuclease [Saprospirales bacterium]|nr:endonuclease [Saprospirales bacterium]